MECRIGTWNLKTVQKQRPAPNETPLPEVCLIMYDADVDDVFRYVHPAVHFTAIN